MPQIINTNIASLNAQRNLNTSQRDADVALQRLSSGLRINSAKDDAAGLAISTRFESQINGLNVAQRNANDGISLAQTTEGALGEVITNLQRIRELAVQSANATNSASDRQALDQEVQQRIEEIDRIAKQTTFNGLKVLDGSFGNQTFQVGANAGDTIGVDLTKGSRATDIGSLASTGDVQVVSTSGGTFTLQVGDAQASDISIASGASAADVVEAVSAANVQGLASVTATNVQTLSFADVAAASSTSGGTYTVSIKVGDADAIDVAVAVSTGGTITASDVASAVKAQGIDGLEVSSATGSLTFTAAGGENITLTESATTGVAAVTGNGFTDTAITSPLVGQVSIEALDSLTITDAAGIIGGTRNIAPTKSMADVKVDTVENANDAIKRVDSALTSINGIRSELGAVQNRFESTIANLSTSAENLSAANSRIRDADFAAETAELARTQVLQQAGLSVLAQANARPQQVLQLLQ
ncbi:MAG: flagellin [Marinobacter sp.]|nr:flagellin [Marinobacter sp.]